MIRIWHVLVLWSALFSFRLIAADANAASLADGSFDDAPVTVINRQITRIWQEYDLEPSSAATAGEWCRRVYLDVLGRIPTVDELKRYRADRSSDKKARLVGRLLYDEEYTEEYARNWTTIWTNLLIGRTGGTQNNSLINRDGMRKYLRDSFARNKSYDRLVHELVAANGTTTPGSENFNGAVNFLVMKLDDKGIQATAKTAQLFLGMQVQCTQCHDHPFNGWKQNQFWEFNAFFRQTTTLRRFQQGTNDVREVELADQDFAGEGSSPSEAEIYYELRNGILKAAYPAFVDGTQLENRSGYLSEVNRREALAKQIIASDYLGMAIVNRMWSHFFGYGFTKPVDDIGPHNPPSHPDLLDYLAGHFRENNFDLKQLMQWIVLSQPYGLSSRTTKANQSDDPLLGESPKFSSFYLRQMRAEELYESLLVATQADRTHGNYAERERARGNWLRQFSRAFGTDEGDETTTFNGTIPQALMMFNGELIRRATALDSGGFLAQVADSQSRPTQQIEHLFLAALARKPTKTELQSFNRLLLARGVDSAQTRAEARSQAGSQTQAGPYGGKRLKKPWKNQKQKVVDPRRAALQDIWWAVLNSNEFILNH